MCKNDVPIYRDSYSLLMDIFVFSNQMSREYKYTIGERLKNESVDMMIDIWRGLMLTGQEKLIAIKNARRHLEIIRLVLRIMKDLRQLALERFADINEKLETVARQLSSWQIKIADI